MKSPLVQDDWIANNRKRDKKLTGERRLNATPPSSSFKILQAGLTYLQKLANGKKRYFRQL
jgi:hypothetical protein